MKDLLPIGSVVLLKDATKKLMIIGILQVKPDEEKIYDYLAVPFPEGYLGKDSNFLFSHEDVQDVIYRGYENPQQKDFMHLVSILYDKKQEEAKNNSVQ